MPRNPNIVRCPTCGSISTSYRTGDNGEPLCNQCGGSLLKAPAQAYEDPTQPPPAQPPAPAPSESPAEAAKAAPPTARLPAAANGQSSALTLRYVSLGRALEAPARTILAAAQAAQAKAKSGKKPSAAWVNSEDVQRALEQLDAAFATPEQQKRRALAEAFEKAVALRAEGKDDEALDLLAQVNP